MARLQQKVNDLEYELTEARAELARHHRDFAKISAILEHPSNGAYGAYEKLTQIKNIVG